MNDVRGVRYPDVRVPMVGEDGNAFAILGRVQKALRRAGVEPEKIQGVRPRGDGGRLRPSTPTVMAWVHCRAEGVRADPDDDYAAVETAWEAFKEANGHYPSDADEFEEWKEH